MTLSELRYLTAIARERHFGRAAAACFVSQPTLSVAVRKLEEELGVTLFERRPHSVVVTPIGQQIVEQAQRVLEAADDVKAIAQAGKDPLGTPLRLGAIYTVGPYLFPALIPALRHEAPNMPLIIEENFTTVLAEQLRQNRLDAIIVSEPFGETGLTTAPLYDEPFVVAMPQDHAWTRRTHIDPAMLSDETALLLSAGNCFRDQVFKVCPALQRRGNDEVQKTLEGSSLETIRYMVAGGTGITVLPCTAVASPSYHSLVATRPFSALVPKRRIVVAWRARFPRERAIEALRTAVRACDLPCVEWTDDE